MDRIRQSITELVCSMLAGDKSSLSHLITLVEEESPDVPKIIELVTPHLHKTYRIGITGPPGVGKSTLIDKLTTVIRNNGLTVGVVAVDPSSAVTGGAVLGDRIRMQRHYLDDKVFIRSMATRGSYGGLSKAVSATVDLLDAYGKDIILIETTGVGQTEVEVIKIADITVVVLVPGYGDSIQLMKAGLAEIADVVVINKTDCDGAENLALELRGELRLSPRKAEPSIFLAQATTGSGIEELYQELEKRRYVPKS